MDIRFYNTHNPVIPLLEDVLVWLNDTGTEAQAYTGYSNYRSIRGENQPPHFRFARLTYLLKTKGLINVLMYAVSALWRLAISKEKLSVFFTQPPLFIIPASWICRLRGRPYAIHMMDMYPELLVSHRLMSAQSFFYKCLKYGMASALKNAAHVYVPGDDMGVLLEAKGIPEERVSKILNYPRALTRTLTPGSFRQSQNLGNAFLVCYAGNMGVGHRFDTLLSLALKYNRSGRNVKFLFIGSGKRRKEVEAFIRENALSNCVLLDSLPQDDFASALKDADVHFVSLREEFHGLMVPSKFYSALVMGRPVIFEGPVHSEPGRVLLEQGTGIIVPPGDSQALEIAIERLMTEPATGRAMSDQGLQYARIQLNKDKILQDYAESLKGLAGINHARRTN